jgi:hypothetical protein
MRIAVLTPLPHRPHARALCAALRDAGQTVDALVPDADGWRGADAVLADTAALPMLPPARQGDPPVAAWLSVAPAALPNGLAAVVATDEASLQMAKQSGVDATRIHFLPLGVEASARGEGPLAEECLLWASGDAGTIVQAVRRLTDLAWRMAGLSDEASPDLAERWVTMDETAWAQAGALVLAQQGDSLADDALLLDQALARGLPVAVAGADALQRRVPPDAGVIAATGDHAALSLALRRVIFDAALRRSLAEAAWSHGRALPRRAEQAARLAALLESLR